MEINRNPPSTNFIKTGDEIGAIRSLPGSIQCAFGMHLNNPLNLLPKRLSTQTYILFLWFYCFVITIAYSTTLTAFLTVKKLPKQIETIQDLHDSGNIILGLDNFYKNIFESSHDSRLHDFAESYLTINDENEIFRQLNQRKSAYQGNDIYLDFLIATKYSLGSLPQFRVMKECFGSHSLAFGLQNHSPLTRKFNHVLQGMMSGGLIDRFYINTLRLAATTKEYGAKDDDSTAENNSGSGGNLVPLSLDHMQGIFFILIICWMASFIVFVVEIV